MIKSYLFPCSDFLSQLGGFLQIVDIANFSMKLNGRWFPQIVDRDSGNLYPIYINKIVVLASEPVCGRSRATSCLVLVVFMSPVCDEVFLTLWYPWIQHSVPQDPQKSLSSFTFY